MESQYLGLQHPIILKFKPNVLLDTVSLDNVSLNNRHLLYYVMTFKKTHQWFVVGSITNLIFFHEKTWLRTENCFTR